MLKTKPIFTPTLNSETSPGSSTFKCTPKPACRLQTTPTLSAWSPPPLTWAPQYLHPCLLTGGWLLFPTFPFQSILHMAVTVTFKNVHQMRSAPCLKPTNGFSLHLDQFPSCKHWQKKANLTSSKLPSAGLPATHFISATPASLLFLQHTFPTSGPSHSVSSAYNTLPVDFCVVGFFSSYRSSFKGYLQKPYPDHPAWNKHLPPLQSLSLCFAIILHTICSYRFLKICAIVESDSPSWG